MRFLVDRCVTIREMVRLHGFPDWFHFHVTKWHDGRQIGNSVPPPLARAVATCVGPVRDRLQRRAARSRTAVPLRLVDQDQFYCQLHCNNMSIHPVFDRCHYTFCRKRAMGDQNLSRCRPLGLTNELLAWISSKQRLGDRVRSYASEAGLPNVASPSSQAVEDALSFIELIPDDAEPPSVALADDGEINFYWRQEGLFIDVGFVGDSKMHYYACSDADQIDVDGSVDFAADALPQYLAAAIPRRSGEDG